DDSAILRNSPVTVGFIGFQAIPPLISGWLTAQRQAIPPLIEGRTIPGLQSYACTSSSSRGVRGIFYGNLTGGWFFSGLGNHFDNGHLFSEDHLIGFFSIVTGAAQNNFFRVIC